MTDVRPLKISQGHRAQFGDGDTVPVAHGGTGATTAAEARANLGLSSLVGSIAIASSASTGALICAGQEVSRANYADLYAVIGDTYGAGDGATTFNLPNAAAETFISATSDLSSATTGHTISLLGDGRLLMIGGNTGNVVANTYFGVISGNVITWTAGTPLPAVRQLHRTVILGDNRVLVIGGTNGSASQSTTYFGVISGDTITWTSGTAMGDARYGHALQLLADGRIVVIAGRNASGTALSSVVFGTISGDTITWAAGTTYPQNRYLSACVLLSDGRLLVVGGVNGSTYYSESYLGVISGNAITWTLSTPCPVGIGETLGATIADGKRIVLALFYSPTAPRSTVFTGIVVADEIIWCGSAIQSLTAYNGAMVTVGDSVLLAGGLGISAQATCYKLHFLNKYIKT